MEVLGGMTVDSERLRILVIDRGYVLVARCVEPAYSGLWLTTGEGLTVRNWGTTKGLAELCDGPTEGTVTDATFPAAGVPVRAILFVLELTDEGVSKWGAKIVAGRTTRPADSSTRTGSRTRAGTR